MFIDDIRTDKSCIRISIIWIYHTIKLVEDRVKKEDIKMKLFVKLIFVANFLHDLLLILLYDKSKLY